MLIISRSDLFLRNICDLRRPRNFLSDVCLIILQLGTLDVLKTVSLVMHDQDSIFCFDCFEGCENLKNKFWHPENSENFLQKENIEHFYCLSKFYFAVFRVTGHCGTHLKSKVHIFGVECHIKIGIIAYIKPVYKNVRGFLGWTYLMVFNAMRYNFKA